jgi:hypothetical protein
MKDLKHTKEKWSLEYPIVGDFVIHADGLRIASIHLIDDKLEEQEANAKLIAAAPELLEVAENALKLLEKLSKYDNQFKGQIAGNICDLHKVIKNATE